MLKRNNFTYSFVALGSLILSVSDFIVKFLFLAHYFYFDLMPFLYLEIILPVAAIIVGVIALIQMRHDRTYLNNRWMAFTGIFCGIAIISIDIIVIIVFIEGFRSVNLSG